MWIWVNRKVIIIWCGLFLFLLIVFLLSVEIKDLHQQLFHNRIKKVTFSSRDAKIKPEILIQRHDVGLIDSLSRAFPVWTNRSFYQIQQQEEEGHPYSWCQYRDEPSTGIININQEEIVGLLYVKVPKSASTTCMGVTLRIADTMGRRLPLHHHHHQNSTGKYCFARYRHGIARQQRYGQRLLSKSFLWTMLRHPSERVLSDYFFRQVSRRHQNVTFQAMMSYIQQNKWQGFLLDYVTLETSQKLRDNDDNHDDDDDELLRRSVLDVVQRYDFIGISERMTESLVVLSMILQIPIADVILFSSKASGGYDDGRSRFGCVKIHPKWTFPDVDTFLYHDFIVNNSDWLLYQAVNASLDKTIEQLGHERVQTGIYLYNSYSAIIHQECLSKAIFPCPRTLENHTSQAEKDCYFSDGGCGHECIDNVLKNASNMEWTALANEGLFFSSKENNS